MLAAWHDLKGERAMGGMGGFGPLSWQAFDRWACRHGVDGADADFLWLMLSALDAEWLDFQAERQAEQARNERGAGHGQT